MYDFWVMLFGRIFDRMKFYPCQSMDSKAACCVAICWFLPLFIIFIIKIKLLYYFGIKDMKKNVLVVLFV